MAKAEEGSRKDVKKRQFFYFPFEVFGKREREKKKKKGERNNKYLCQILNILLSEFLLDKL